MTDSVGPGSPDTAPPDAAMPGGSTYGTVYTAVGASAPLKGQHAEFEHRPRSIEPPLGLLPERIHGRDDVKPELVTALRRHEHPTLRVLHGIAGGGKSSLALWLAAQARDQGRDIYWIGNSDVEQSMREVAVRRGVDANQVHHGKGPDQVWRSLEEAAEPWLLIFDNVDDVDQPGLLGDAGRHLDGTGWIRPSRAGLVVVTSRHSDSRTWGDAAVLTQVRPLGDADGAQVLYELAEHAGTRQDAERLAARLGGLPLALRLAGHYLAGNPLHRRTFSTYLEAIEHDLRLLDAAEPIPALELDDAAARRSIRLTWELSLTLLQERRLPQARPLLHLLACYGAPDPIPVDLLDVTHLQGTPVDCGAPLTDVHLDTVVRGLVSAALADQIMVPTAGGDEIPHVALHPLLAEVVASVRDEDPAYSTDIWTAAVTLLNKSSPATPEPEAWVAWPKVPSVHEAVLRDVPEHLPDLVAAAAEDGNLCAAYLLRIGRIEASHRMSSLAVTKSAVLDPQHPVRLTARLTAAMANQAQGSSAARDELGALLDDASEVLPRDSPLLVLVRQQLAYALWSTGVLDEAEEIYRDLLDDHENGIAVHQALATRFGYGQLMSTRGEYDVAEREISAVLAAERELYQGNEEHPDVLVTRAVLADVWAAQGHFVRARQELQDVLRAQERIHGPDSPLTLAARVTLLGVFNLLSDEGGAQLQLSQLLRIQRDALNPEHPLALLGLAALINRRAINPDTETDPRVDELRLNEVAAALARSLDDDHLIVLSIRVGAAIQHCLYDLRGGLADLRSVLDRQSTVYGGHHTATLNTRLMYAQLLVESDSDNPVAEQELRDLLLVQLESIGSDHPQTAMVRSALANITFRNGDLVGSEEFLRQSLETLERLHGRDNNDARETRTTLVQVLNGLGRHADAERELLVLVESLERTEPHSDDTLGGRLMLALVRWGAGRHTDAERDLRALLATLLDLDGEHRYQITVVRWVLAEVLRERGTYSEAESLLRTALGGLVELGDPEDEVAAVRLSLGELLQETDRLAEAEPFLQLALTELRKDDSPLAERAQHSLTAVSAELQALTAPETPVVVAAPEPVAADPWRAYLSGSGERPPGAVPAVVESPAAVPVEPVPAAPVLPAVVPAPVVDDPLARAVALRLRGRLDDADAALADVRSTQDSVFERAMTLWARGRLTDAERLMTPLSAGRTAELVALRRELCRTHQEDARLCAELAALAASEPDARRRYGLALADAGFPTAAYGQLCAARSAFRRTGGLDPVALVSYAVDAALVRPGGGDRVYRDVVAEVGEEHGLALRLRRHRAEWWPAERAVDELAETLDLRARLCAPPDREHAQIRHALGVALHRAGDLAAAQRMLRQAAVDLADLLGEQHPQTLMVKAAAAAVLATSEPAAATEQLTVALAAQLRRRGAGHPDVASTRHWLGVAARASGSRARAVEELAVAARIRTVRLGADHPDTMASRAALAAA